MGVKLKKKIKLSADERDIEKNVHKLVPISTAESKRIFGIIEKAKKNTSISLRINNYDLDKLKLKAEKNGLPYQSLITTVLHKFINEEYFEKNEVLKTMKVFREAI